MAISTEVRRAGPFEGNGTQTDFPFGFKVFSAGQVRPVISTDGGETESDLSAADFTVTLSADQDVNAGGTVHLTNALAKGAILTIISAVPYLQPVVLTNRGGFYPEILNQSLDRATAQIQQIAEKQARSLAVPATSAKTPEQLTQELLSAQKEAQARADAAAASAAAAKESEKKTAEYAEAALVLEPFGPAIKTVADTVDAVVSVSGVVEGVKSVSQVVGQVQIVGDNIEPVKTAADDIAAIREAPGHAATAASAASEAASSKEAAETAANLATASSNLARQWATRESDPVDGELYGAKYYAGRAKASDDSAASILIGVTTEGAKQVGLVNDAGAARLKEIETAGQKSADAAAESAASAATSATAAANSAAAARSSETNARSSETNAKSSQTAAATQATNASNSAKAAAVSQAAAASSEAKAKEYANQAAQGQLQADWTEADATAKTYVKNLPVIDGVDSRGLATISHFAVCSTAAAVAEKAVSVPGFKLVAGARLLVFFIETNTAPASGFRIKVNTLDAVAVKWRGGSLPNPQSISANSLWEFVYDGANFIAVGDFDRNIVWQEATTAAGEIPVLLKGTTDSRSTTSSAKFAASVTLNPSTGTITATAFKGALSGKATAAASADSATTASKLGTANVGAATTPIYLKAGVATAGTPLARVATTGAYADLSGGPDLTPYAKKAELDNYLPLTGGTMSGAIFLNGNRHYIRSNTSTEFSGLELSGGNVWQNGAGLFLRSTSATGPDESGQWGLVAHDASGAEGALIGRVGDIRFNGEQIERASEISGKALADGFWDVCRYATGLQIIVAGISIPANQLGVTYTFPRPFINQSVSIAANGATEMGDVSITWASDTNTGIRLYRKNFTGAYSFPTYVKCAFIGRWK